MTIFAIIVGQLVGAYVALRYFSNFPIQVVVALVIYSLIATPVAWWFR